MSVIIGVCGGSGSGKTTLARRLTEALGPDRTTSLSFDSYYRDFAHLNPEQRAALNFDHPDSLDTDLLVAHLDALRTGNEIAVPVYDFATHTRSGNFELAHPTEFVVIEGILLFSSEAVRERLDHLIFRDCPPEVRYERRLIRDVAERGRSQESVHEQWRQTVQPMHEIHVDPFIGYADVVTHHGYDLDLAIKQLAHNLSEGLPLAGCLDQIENDQSELSMGSWLDSLR